MMCLEERITRLEDIEAIRQLQARYQRCLDTRNWEEMERCFTEAAIYHVDYRKEEGCWKICRIGYERCYEYFEFRGLLNQLTLRKTTFLDRLKKKHR